MYGGLEVRRNKRQHSVFLYSDALGRLCGRAYHGFKNSSIIPPVSTAGFQLVVRGSDTALLSLKTSRVVLKRGSLIT
jgi:hypothetical protein